MKEATCLKCGDIYNPDEFGELHLVAGCNGEPTKEGEYGQKVKPWLSLSQIESAIENDFNFDAFVENQDTHADNVALDLIGNAYDLDGESLHDEELLALIQEILAMRNSWVNRHN
jgi:hypothetical protein